MTVNPYLKRVRDLEEDPVKALRVYAEQYSVASFASVVLDDPRFPLWSGSSKPHQHHYGKGGLARHTLEVVELCLNTTHYFRDLDLNETALFLAATFHDFGKTKDYEPIDVDFKDWRGTQHKRRIHHISSSVMSWNEAARGVIELDGIIDEVTHAILAHHMQREWGSPVSPSTKLAWILSMCDNMSARVDDCDKFDRH